MLSRKSRQLSHSIMRDAADQEDHVAQHGEQRIGGDALDFADVVVEARDQVAESPFRVEARREGLQVAIEGQAHVEQHGGGDADVLIARQDVQQESEDGGAEHHGRTTQQRARKSRRRRAVSIRSFEM